jgi:hypothetical protein
VYKIRSKKITILLTLIFVLSIMLPLAGPASAATTNSVIGAVPVVSATGDFTLAGLRVAETSTTFGDIRGGDVILLTLPSGVRFEAAETPATIATFFNAGASNLALNAGASSISADRRSAVLAFTRTNLTDVARIDLAFRVTVTSLGTGDINVALAAPGTAITEGTYTLGRFATGAATVAVLATPTRGDGTQVFGTIRISENSIGALGTSTAALNTILLTLPAGFTWNAATTVNGYNLVMTGAGFTIDPAGAGNNRVMSINIGTASTARPGIIDIVPSVNVTPAATKGDIEVAFGGTNIVSGNYIIGKYGDWGVKVLEGTPKNVRSGRNNQELGDFTIAEDLAGSLINTRSLTLTLPANAVFTAAPTGAANVRYDAGTAGLLPVGAATLSADSRTASWNLAAGSTAASKVRITGLRVNVRAGVSGDLTLKVGGSAGAAGEVVVAKIIPAVSAASASIPTVIIGAQNQAAGDITITEGLKGMLREGNNLTVTVPAGAEWAATPTVEVTEGNVTFNKDGVGVAGRTLTIPITAESTNPSTIKISNIKYTTFRTLPEGNLTVEINGAAVNQSAFVGSIAATVVNAKCGTPAPVEKKQTAAFVIGATTYTVGGVEAKMDVAPYTKDGRTYLPVRFAGLALGVAEENIFWDNATATATLMKGDRVVQFTVGQKAMVINGGRVAIDVAPEVANGRVMLPFRWIATAFGASVAWDTATQTVTMEL